jgi:hypothetical protein
MGRFRTCQERESRSHEAPWAQPLAPEGRDAIHGPVADAPIPARLSRPPTNRPARVAQSSDEGVDEADAGWVSRGPRFARFAAAMEANPASQDQLFPRSQRRGDSMATSSTRPLRRVRSLTADQVKSLPGIQWLGIGSWAFFCVALFVSLLPHPGRDAVDRGTGLQADHTLQRAIVSGVPPAADPIPLPSDSRGFAMRPPAPAPGPGG